MTKAINKIVALRKASSDHTAVGHADIPAAASLAARNVINKARGRDILSKVNSRDWKSVDPRQLDTDSMYFSPMTAIAPSGKGFAEITTAINASSDTYGRLYIPCTVQYDMNKHSIVSVLLCAPSKMVISSKASSNPVTRIAKGFAKLRKSK